MLQPALWAAFAGVVGILIGRFWDSKSEQRRWRRDHRIRLYEQLAGSYYLSREAYRALAMQQPDTPESDRETNYVLDLSVEFNRTLMALWLHGSTPAAAAAHALDLELNRLFVVARSQQLSLEEWRVARGPAERAMEKFIEIVRRELRLPPVSIQTHVDEIAESTNGAS